MYIIKDQFDPKLRKNIKRKNQVAIIPVGSIEQHGPHLPISTDSDIVTEICRRIAIKRKYLLLPTINYGVSFEHAPFFNISLRSSTLRSLLKDICKSLKDNGIKNVFIINGHHGNVDAIYKLDKELSKQEFKVFVFSYWHYMIRKFDHAGFVETSLMLAITKNVKMNLAKKGFIDKGISKTEIKKIGKIASKSFISVTKNGIWGDPRDASRGEGIRIMQEIVTNLQKNCQNCLTSSRR